MLRDPIGRPARPPGLIVAGASVLLCTGIVFALLDWWPDQGHTVVAFTNSMVVLVFGVLLVIVGLVWVVKSALVIGRDPRWSWWIAVASVVVVSDVQVGPYTMSGIFRRDNAVYFYDADQSFLTTFGGWIYSPAGPPPDRAGIERFETTHLDGPWYEFTAVWQE